MLEFQVYFKFKFEFQNYLLLLPANAAVVIHLVTSDCLSHSCSNFQKPVPRKFVFTARRYASAVLAVIVCLSVRPSVCLSVCLSQVGVVQRWLNLGSD